MHPPDTRSARAPGRLTWAIWGAVGAAILVPLLLAATSPFLASRTPAYVVAGFAGILCLALFLLQPLLAAGYLPGLRLRGSRWAHRLIGVGIVVSVLLHIGGLYLTSPPDTMDALLLVSPTPFSVYGVIAMWGVLVTALIVALRHRLGLRYSLWRLVHNGLAAIVVVATVVHALQIDGTMEPVSKWLLCIAVLAVNAAILLNLRVIKPLMSWFQQTGRSRM